MTQGIIMQGKRIERVAHLLQMELGQLIVTRLKDPGLGFLTITHVEMPPDLKSAIVYFSVIGNEQARQRSQAALDRARGYLQREIALSLKFRHTPILQFRYDNTFEEGVRVDRILYGLQEGKTQGDDGSAQEKKV